MASLKPFSAIRPVRNKVHLVTTRSYITYSKKQWVQKFDSNPYSFIHVIHPEGVATDKLPLIERYQKVRSKFQDFIDRRFLQKETSPCLYIYQQTIENHSYLGIVGLASLIDYEQNKIKKHESTISKREDIFTQYLDTTQIQAEPVLLTYPHHEEVEQWMLSMIKDRPEYEFTTTDKVLHEVWIVQNQKDIEQISQIFAQIPALYIADGHHRMASSYHVYQKNTDPKFAHVLSYFISEKKLNIKGFNRFLSIRKDLLEFQKDLSSYFNILPLEAPDSQGIKMYFSGKWFLLKPIHSNNGLDVEIFTRKILQEILQVKDVRNIPFIHYAPNYGLYEQIEKDLVYYKSNVAFVIDPAKMKDIFQYSDQGKTLPPKSTWVEPKLRSALLMYQYESFDRR